MFMNSHKSAERSFELNGFHFKDHADDSAHFDLLTSSCQMILKNHIIIFWMSNSFILFKGFDFDTAALSSQRR